MDRHRDGAGAAAAGVAAATGSIDGIITVVMRMRNQLAFEDLMAEDASDLPDIDVPEETVALIMYTSGTTASPKGRC